jgi:hypothetical protein
MAGDDITLFTFGENIMTFLFTNEALIESFEARLKLIRDRVRSVAEGYHTAAYLVGRPGTSKTFTVKEKLDRMGVPFLIRNARMSPMGLFDLLEENPEHIIVLDDIVNLFNNKQGLQILMAALDGDPEQPRTITYKTKNENRKVEFAGGIIAISNVPLRNDPLAQAVASRVTRLEHEPTDQEIAAFMRRLAADGYKDLWPDQCLEVAEFVIDETRAFDGRLDLRHLTKAWEDRRQWEDDNCESSWEDLVRSSLGKIVVWNEDNPFSKREDIAQQRERVAEALRLFPGDVDKQMEFSGLKKSTFYKRRKEVGSAA